jgi:acetyltransferase-like isoleucine patch superfamily enzyme
MFSYKIILAIASFLFLFHIFLHRSTSINLCGFLNMIYSRIIYLDILKLKPVVLFPYVKFSYKHSNNIQIGDNTFINRFTHISSEHEHSKVIIGKQCLIAPNVLIVAHSHMTALDFNTRIEMIPNTIIIKENVWIGAGTIIIGNVTIGENSIIGAGSVVVKSLPPNCLAVGNPAKVKRFLK